jgi:DNA-nicking Smr family endonuclease
MGGRDKDPWAKAIEGVKPLSKGGKVTTPSPPVKGRPIRQQAIDFEPPAGGPLHQNPFDPLLYQKIADGKLKIEFRYDLHGMTEARAFEMLCYVLEGAFVEGKRRGLIITGKGRRDDSPIRAALPKWLSSPRLARIVSSFDYSAQRHGGDGAFYVLLRKQP